MQARDRSRIRQFDRALAVEWEEPCPCFGHTLNIGTIDRDGVCRGPQVEPPMCHEFRYREPLAYNPFDGYRSRIDRARVVLATVQVG